MTDTLAGLSTSKQRLLERMLAGREAVRSDTGVAPRPQGSTVPLSPEQMSIWLHAALVPHEPIYNEPITIRSAGRLDRALLERSLNIFAGRHELWRTAFRVAEGRVEQMVHQEADIRVLEATVTGESTLEREQEALRIAAADAREPFNPEQAPLIRAKLIALSQSDQRLYLTLHHLLFDGISLTRVLLPELAAIYEACRADREPDLPRPRLQYGDYAAWRANDRGSASDSLSWWRRELSGELPVLDLDVARAKTRRSQAGAMERFALPPTTVSRLKDFSHSQGATLYAILLAAYAVLLHRHSSNSDILIGGVTDTRRRAELQGLFGCFLNTIVLRVRPNKDESFRRFVATVQETVLAALDHSDVSFDQIVREVRPNRAGLRHPVFQAMFSMQPPPAVAGGWDMAQMDVATGLSKFDLYLELEERSDSFLGRFLYATDLFDAPTVRDLLTEWLAILERALQEPDVTLGTLAGPSIPASSGGPAMTPTSIEHAFETFPDWFEHQVRTNPNAIALEFEGQVATYQALGELTDSFALHLRKLGIGPEKLVAVALERSFDLVVWLLAILKSGGAYLPIDPSQPRFRITSVIEDAKPDLILLDGRHADNLPVCGIPQLDCSSFTSNKDDGDALEDTPKAGPMAHNLAYVIYTSGSTGKPKGVQITHESLVNLLAAMKRRFALGPIDRALAINTLSFDFSVAEIFLPLVSGARLIVARREDARDPFRLKSLIERTQCTLLQGTPATWRGLIASGWSGRRNLTIVSGGEALAPDLAQRLLACGSSLWNVYGPTETTVFAIVHKVGVQDEMSVPIGRPIDNVRAHVVGENGALVTDTGEGELFIGGPGVARGYRNDPKLTGERFVALSVLGSERLYRTGDIVRRSEGGSYEWLGRTDNQVKIRGFRVGLEEIETALQWHPDVVAAAVRAWPDASGGMSLCAYIVHVGDPDLVRFGLRIFLRERLPEHMVPSRFIALDRLPLTPSGKVARKQLPEPKRNTATRRIDEPRDAVERDLVQIWCSLLGLPQVGIHDNFFDLGGHSVLAFLMIAEVKRLAGGRELPLSAVLSNPTIALLANLLKSDPVPFSHLAPLKREGTGNPLFIVHGAFGHILVFKRFADQIQTQRPVYAVQAGGTDPDAAVERTIEEMSDTYLDAIRTVQPHGPYALAGYSFGGLIAYEMARKLQQAGETVQFLGLIDTYVHHQNLPPSEKWLYYLSLPLHLAQKLASLEPRQWPSYLRKRTEMFYRRATLRFRAPGDAGLSYDWSEVMPESSAQMYEVALREYLSYRLKNFEGTVSFFRASQRSLGECNPIPAWRAAVGRLDVHDVRGNHGTILEEDVAGLAQALSASLAGVDAPRVAAPFAPIKDRKPRILVVTMMRWPSTVRLCMALKEAGFAIAAMAPERHGLRALKVCSEVFPCPIGNGPGALADAVHAWSPDLLIPADEFAVRYLHNLYWKCDGELAALLRPLIDRSQGAASSHSITTSRAAFMALARRENIAVPETTTLAAMRKEGAEKGSGRIQAPLVLKLDGTSGGEGVRIVRSIVEIDEAARRLVHPPWLEIAKDILLTRSVWPLRERMHRAEKEVVVQKFIPGSCANRAVVCWNGEVLAGISAEAVETVSPTGPSSVVRLVENQEMAEITARLVRRLGLSGFCGFDFVLEERTGKPILIELNPRPTPSCHLAFNRITDMVGALFARMTGSAARATEAETIPAAIAYFPQEMWRNPSSKHLKKVFHDVPWEEPDFVEMYFRPHSGDWPVQLALKLRRLWPTAITGKLFSSFTVAKDR